MPLHDLTEFFSLSRALYYNLSAGDSGREFILMYVTAQKPLPRVDRQILLRTINTLVSEYKDETRRLGPPAVLHPLRATALLARSSPELDLLDLLSELTHDLFEDIYPFHFAPNWKGLIFEEFASFYQIERNFGRVLFERLDRLRLLEEETYYQYIGRLLGRSYDASELVRIKMADRLDNTLDMRIDLQDSLEAEDFYEKIFEILFLNLRRKGTPPDHPPPSSLDGAWRLYALFKNAVLLSLVRQNQDVGLDEAAKNLFRAVAKASIKETQRIFLHILLYHRDLLGSSRALALDAMDYCASGRNSVVTSPEGPHRLDGLFTRFFDYPPAVTAEEAERMEPAEIKALKRIHKEARKKRLSGLYRDKPLMFQAALAFGSIFHSFLRDESYYVRGIETQGLAPG
jgi:hypothetical protein